jgi:hypothetical protein
LALVWPLGDFWISKKLQYTGITVLKLAENNPRFTKLIKDFHLAILRRMNVVFYNFT